MSCMGTPQQVATDAAKPLFSYRPYWAHRFGTAPFLPMSRARYSDRGGLRKGIDDFGPKKAAKIRPRFAHTSGCPDQLQQPRGHAIACPRGISSGIPTPLVGPS